MSFPEPPEEPGTSDGDFDQEPPGPGRWEWSDAYGWVEAQVSDQRGNRVWSEQFKCMVEVDADGRVIPPE